MLFRPTNSIRQEVSDHRRRGRTGSVTRGHSRGARRQAALPTQFVVVSIDGTGTPNRSKGYTDVLRCDGAAQTIPDQIAGMKELAKKYPWIDIDRAAMWGHSGGGFITADALLRAPYNDFFKVGIAESGNHDQR